MKIKNTTLNAKTVLVELNVQGVHPDSLTRTRDGVYTLRRGFFYTHGRTAEALAAEVKEALLGRAEIISTREHWGMRRYDCYWEVKFRLPADFTLSEKAVVQYNEFGC